MTDATSENIQHQIDVEVIEPLNREWARPVALVPRNDGQFTFVWNITG